MGEPNPRTLYLVPTPLGNLKDLTRRAEHILANVDLVACEDTRRTAGLMTHLGLSKPLVSFHGHSSPHKVERLVADLQTGRSIALVSDAGTPGLSDPGTDLVQAAIAAGISVISLPGACAATTSLVGSGLPTDRFIFLGFLPRRTARARRAIEATIPLESTVIIYESPFRTADTVDLIRQTVGDDTRVVIARELTKVFEEWIRGTAAEVAQRLQNQPLKGEVVILFNPSISSTEARISS